MNEKNKSTLILASMFSLTVVFFLLCGSRISWGQSRMGRANIPFKGNATGGTLVIGYIQDPHYVHTSTVSIDTFAGESAESVVNHLAAAITSSDAIYSNMSKNPANAEKMRKELAQGHILSLINIQLTNYILAGTETGLGIPKPPLCLSCSYNKQAHTIDVKWVNSSDDSRYDSLRILWRYRSRPEDTLGSGGSKFVWGTPTSITIKLPAEVSDFDTDIWIKGLRHEMPIEEMRAKGISLTDNVISSNATAIHLTSNGFCQEETYGIPFFAGVAPNWAPWSTGANAEKTIFEQGDKYAGVRRYEPVKALLTNPYYQVIKASPQGGEHGVYRKFLGLAPGHTYRLTACLSTLEMDSIKGDWSFSLHAASNEPDGKDLTGQQMAGLAPLPDGRSGPQAGRIAFRGPGNTTKGAFDLVFSGDKNAGDPQSSHITLPVGADTITVWVRFRCSDPKGKVGFSGVKLEDITAIENPKSPEEVRDEETAEEIRLLKWMEKAAREASGAEPRP